jgi:hypothetical protein
VLPEKQKSPSGLQQLFVAYLRISYVFCGNIDSLGYLFHWGQLLFLNLQGDMTARRLNTATWIVTQETL